MIKIYSDVKRSLLLRKNMRHAALLLLLAGVLFLLLGETSLAAPPPSAAASIVTRVDNAGDVGEWTSLALNSSGFPVISYYKDTGSDLLIAVCHDAACLNTPSLNTVDSAGDVGTHTSLALNSSGFPVISYYDASSHDLKVATCHDAACANPPTIKIVDNGGTTYVGQYSSLALNSSGFPVISYFNITNSDLKVATCHDATCSNAPTIKTVDGGGYVGYYSSLALNNSGFPIISYYDINAKDLKVAVCHDGTCSSTPTITIVDSGGAADVGQNSSLALSSSGFPIISYYDATNGDLKVAACNDAACTVSTKNVVDGEGKVGNDSSLALNSSGFPVISYYDDSNDRVKVAICADAICSSPTLRTVHSAISQGYDTSLALSSSNVPVISLFDFDSKTLIAARCSSATCSSANPATVDDSGNVGQWSSLALNGSGFAVISYHDETNFDLKLAVCNNAACSNPSIKTVDAGPDIVGGYTSLVLNSSGFPVISYYSWTDQALMLAICSDAACANPATIRAVDNPVGGNVGWYTSLALNSFGLPVISYYDATKDDLKVAVCNNATCTQPTLTTVDAPGDVGRYTSLALTSDDYPIISYFDETNDNLKLAVCNDIACGKPTLVTVDSPGSVGRYNSLALNSAGYPVISYYDGYEGTAVNDLKLAIYELPNFLVHLPTVFTSQ